MSYQKYDEIRKERDQLRADNDAMSKRFMAKCLEMDQLRAELEESRKSGEWAAREMSGLRQRNDALIANIIATRADNEALLARLGEATRVIGLWAAVGCWKEPMRLADCGGCGPCQSKAFLAPGSSTGEAAAVEPFVAQKVGFDHWELSKPRPLNLQGPPPTREELLIARERISPAPRMPEEVEPAAPEPAPRVERVLHQRINELTDLTFQDSKNWQAAIEVLDRRVVALTSWANSPFWPMGTPKFATKPVPPQPAPVERHAFYCLEVGGDCRNPGCPCDQRLDGIKCGQPRSAAVHGEGGK